MERVLVSAQFPAQVWDGLSASRLRKDARRDPDVPDFETMRDELQAVQTAFLLTGVGDGNIVLAATKYLSLNGTLILQGAATPEGAVTAPPGSVYSRTNGSVYVKASGSSSTGWAALSTSSSTTTSITVDSTLVANSRTNNTGASGQVVATLPAGAAVGDSCIVDVTAAQSLKVLAPASTTIQLPHATSSAAGYAQSVRVGSSATFIKTSSTTWVASDATGTWRVDLTTGAGFAYTPTAWTTFTGSGAWTANTTYSLSKHRQEGNILKVYHYISLAGAPDAAQLYTNIPTGFNVDAPALGNPYNGQVGQGNSCASTTTGYLYPLSVTYITAVPDKLYVWATVATNPPTQAVAEDNTLVGTGYRIVLNYEVPVL